MRKNKILRYTVIFFVVVTVINVTAALTVLSRTHKLPVCEPEMRNRLFDVESLSHDLELSNEQSNEVDLILTSYRERAESIHKLLRQNHRKSQRAIILNSQDSSIFADAINEYGELHKQMKKESVLFIQKINMILNEQQKESFREIIKERTNCNMKESSNKKGRRLRKLHVN